MYLVAYKSRPKTMRYFLQLVEAIINKRINNAIKLDGFLRVLEKVEEGEIQMINILGADKVKITYLTLLSKLHHFKLTVRRRGK